MSLVTKWSTCGLKGMLSHFGTTLATFKVRTSSFGLTKGLFFGRRFGSTPAKTLLSGDADESDEYIECLVLGRAFFGSKVTVPRIVRHNFSAFSFML